MRPKKFVPRKGVNVGAASDEAAQKMDEAAHTARWFKTGPAIRIDGFGLMPWRCRHCGTHTTAPIVMGYYTTAPCDTCGGIQEHERIS